MADSNSTPADHFWLLAGEVPTGPFSVEHLHAELAAGRVGWQTPACRVGESVWRPLLHTPGFGPSVPHSPAPSGGVPPAHQNTDPPSADPDVTARPAAERPTPRRVRWIALGLLGVCAVVGVVVVGSGWIGNGLVAVEPTHPYREPSPPAVERLTVGPGREVLYSAGLRADAERLARALGEVGYGDGKWPARVQLARLGEVWVVELELKAKVFDDPVEPAALERWVGIPMAAAAFPGERVEVRLFETDGPERTRFVVDRATRSPIGPSGSAVYSLGGEQGRGDRLAVLLSGFGRQTKVRWVILLARQGDGWRITPLNLRPVEMTTEVRRAWMRDLRRVSEEFSAPVDLDVLGDDYRLVEVLTAGAVGAAAAEAESATALAELGVHLVRDENRPGRPVVQASLYSFTEMHTGAKLRLLSRLEHLTTLDLGHTGVTDAGLKELAPLARLSRLDLTQTSVTDAGVRELVPLTNLTELNLSHTSVTDAGVTHLASLVRLTTLNLAHTKVTDAGVTRLVPLKHLTTLHLDGRQVTDAGVKGLAGFEHLTTLHVACRRSSEVKPLTAVNPQTALHVRIEEVSGDDLRALAPLANLTSLNLHRTQVSDKGLKELAPLKHLATLDLSGVPAPILILPDAPPYPGSQVTDAGLKELARIESLSELNLAYTKVTDAGVKELARLKALTTLNLAHTGMTDKGVQELGRLNNLVRLDLTGTSVTDDGVRQLRAALPKCRITRR